MEVYAELIKNENNKLFEILTKVFSRHLQGESLPQRSWKKGWIKKQIRKTAITIGATQLAGYVEELSKNAYAKNTVHLNQNNKSDLEHDDQ